jgi:C4-type Zn-finger protein
MKERAQASQASTCPSCGAILNTLSHTIWGTKKFDPNSGSYLEDESMGNSDMEVSCPNCSAKLDAEGLLF